MLDDRSAFLRRSFEQLLGEHHVVPVIFMEHPLLKVPDRIRLRGDAKVIFNYGLNLPVSIPDLRVTDVGIWATLSFDRIPFLTFVPWEAVLWIGVPVQDPPETLPKPSRPKLTLVP